MTSKTWRERLGDRWHQFLCGVLTFGKHDYLPAMEPGRITHRCQTCRKETPGWSIDVADRYKNVPTDRVA